MKDHNFLEVFFVFLVKARIEVERPWVFGSFFGKARIEVERPWVFGSLGFIYQSMFVVIVRWTYETNSCCFVFFLNMRQNDIVCRIFCVRDIFTYFLLYIVELVLYIVLV